MNEALRSGQEYLAQGGAVMVPLVFLTFVLYYLLGARAIRLARGGKGDLLERLARLRQPEESPRGLLDAVIRAALRAASLGGGLAPAGRRLQIQAAITPYVEEIARGGNLARTIVVVAPLLGLLGTVGGMIEMFDGLGDQTLYAQDGGIANGISKALFTTQLGLAVAIPGYFLTRLADRREAKLRDEFEQVEHALCGGAS